MTRSSRSGSVPHNKAVELSHNNDNLPWKEVSHRRAARPLRQRRCPLTQDPRHAWLRDVSYDVRD